jgi:deazaflavin-dependent oxidoreductase (nitroreductase family)
VLWLSVNDWNQQVMKEFRANGGKVAQFGDAPLVILHTVGAKSGEVREKPLVCLVDGERLVIFASKAGAPNNPAWFHNLKANPEIDIEYGTERYRARAIELTGAERDDYYARQVALMPQFGDYAEKATDRVIPVLALERV